MSTLNIEGLREEFDGLSESDKRAVANILILEETFAPLEEQALAGTKALFGPELGEEAFRLGTNPDTTQEQIEAFLKKLHS